MYTKQQRLALDERGASVSLSAGAGCGKTFVLTERFVRALEPDQRDSTGVHDVLAITFTKKAAREMRDRIRRKCRERFQNADSASERRHWQRILRELDRATITTIDSFCRSLIRSHSVYAGVDPTSQVLDEGQQRTLLAETTDELLRERWSGQDEGLLELLLRFDLRRFREALDGLLQARRNIDFTYWMAHTPESLAAIWGGSLREYSRAWLDEFLNSADVRIIREISARCESKSPRMRDRFATILNSLQAMTSREDIANEVAVFREAATVQHVPVNQWPSEAVYLAFRDTAKKLRDACDSMLDLTKSGTTDNQSAARMGLNLLALARDIAEEFERRKAESRYLDFDDLLIRAHRLMTGPDGERVARKLAERTRLVLVDEFQDTDPLQVKLVEALCGAELLDGKLFFVGDFKQSIYRFRGARPEVFRELRARIPPAGQLSLTKNFRSQPDILHFANALFAEAFAPDFEPLEPSRPQLVTPPLVEFLWALPPDESTGQEPSAKETKETARRREADWIARRIRGLLDSGDPIVAEPIPDRIGEFRTRPARQGDFTILLRALSDVHLYEEALERYGLDFYVVGGKAFYSRQEIHDVWNTLRAIADPEDEISLAGALRSPFFTLDDETLFWCARSGKLSRGLFAEEVRAKLTPEQSKRAEFAAETLSRLHGMKDSLSVTALLKELIASTGFDAALLGEYLGERKLANLNKLLDLARSVDRRGWGLAEFLYQLGEFVANLPPEAPAATHGESADVVRLMTIHQSKGLEFPIVIVADLNRDSKTDSSPAAFHEKLGPLVRVSSDEKSLGILLYDALEKRERELEETRLFYVAITRAADRLILSAGFDKGIQAGNTFLKLLESRFDLVAGTCRAELPKEWPIPRVQIITDEPVGEPTQKPAHVHSLVHTCREALKSGDAIELPKMVPPIPADPRARRRYSFSRLSGDLRFEDASGDAEHVHTATEIDAREFGEFVHELLEKFEFDEPETELDRLALGCAGDYVTLDAVAIREGAALVREFGKTALARRISSAANQYRELEFLLPWPPGGRSTTGGIYIQGFMDCLYQDDDGAWHIVDYKTNRGSEERYPLLARHYRTQLAVYALAAEQALGVTPASLTVYFLRAPRAFTFQMDDTVRAETIAEVSNGLKKLRGE